MSHQINCMKCRHVTETTHAQVAKTKNGRYRLHGHCADCGSKKSKFVNQQTGEGLLGKLLGLPNGKIPILSDIPLIGAIL